MLFSAESYLGDLLLIQTKMWGPFKLEVMSLLYVNRVLCACKFEVITFNTAFNWAMVPPPILAAET